MVISLEHIFLCLVTFGGSTSQRTGLLLERFLAPPSYKYVGYYCTFRISTAPPQTWRPPPQSAKQGATVTLWHTIHLILYIYLLIVHLTTTFIAQIIQHRKLTDMMVKYWKEFGAKRVFHNQKYYSCMCLSQQLVSNLKFQTSVSET